MITVLLNTALQPHHRLLFSSLFNANIRYLSLLEQYEQRVATGAILNDFEQRNVIFCLNELMRSISQWYSSLPPPLHVATSHRSIFTSLIKRISSFSIFKRKNVTPKGVYIYGDVGCGKTFMMDLFYESCPVREKSRMHFHVFMKFVHSKLHELKQSQFKGNPVSELALSLISETSLLCLDEFQVTDIADAMILTRLFKELYKHPFILITTSNRSPDRLYQNGLQRESFLPCIELIKIHCEVFSMNSGSDYRKTKGISLSRTFFYPINDSNRDIFEKLFLNLVGTNVIEPRALSIYGRAWTIPYTSGPTAKFFFSDLCEQSFGPADYVELSRRFRFIFIANIPKLTMLSKNEARRFISLIDALYENKVILFCLAECHFKELFDFSSKSSTDKDLNQTASGNEEVLAFKRTVSRLYEMNSFEWLSSLKELDNTTTPIVRN